MSKHTQLTHGDHIPDKETLPLILLLDNVTDALNVGSLFRLADALGISSLILGGDTPAPPHKDIRRSARNCDKTVPWEAMKIPEAVEKIRARGYKIVSVELTDHSRELASVDLSHHFPLCLVAGSEQHGVSQYCLDHSDEVVHIAMRGVNSSMNVSAALSIAAYEAGRQCPGGKPPP